jgi:carbamoylphosphate synthase small subunit
LPVTAGPKNPLREQEAEMAYLGEAVDARRPCFGICCGAQILARLLGAGAGKCETFFVGYDHITGVIFLPR